MFASVSPALGTVLHLTDLWPAQPKHTPLMALVAPVSISYRATMATLRNLNLHLLIPIAAGGALSVSACSPEQTAARNYCKTYKDCAESSFEDRFESMSQCVKYARRLEKAETTAWEVAESKECGQAYRQQSKCWAKELSCDAKWLFVDDDDYDYNDPDDLEELQNLRDDFDEWREDVDDACEDEIEEYEDECDLEEDDYDYY